MDWKHPQSPISIKKANKANFDHFQITFMTCLALLAFDGGLTQKGLAV
jgi:hypothetical protein